MPVKIPIVSAVFPACLAVLLLSPFTYASSPEFGWAHSCQAPDHDQLGHELALGPAAKRPAVADSGQTRQLRLIYFLPNDRTFNPDVVDSMKARIPRIRTFFLNQMQSNGKGAMTFEFETDGAGGSDRTPFRRAELRCQLSLLVPHGRHWKRIQGPGIDVRHESEHLLHRR